MSADRFFDTNVLVYANIQGDYRTAIARQLLLDGGVIGVQVLNEFASVARAKLGFTWAEVQEAIENIVILCPNPRPLSIEIHLRALGISRKYGFSIWDGLIVAAAAEARCSKLLTEDLQHGQVVEGVRIENPFLGALPPQG
ncbi:MAG: PIN domain-containing protein [Terracidiphilus sp.]|jgi:predicted nucleic acid-binding protein